MNAFAIAATITTMEETKVVLSFLKANDIEARLSNEHFNEAIGSGTGFGGFKIIVPAAQLSLAKDLLNNPI